MKSTKRLPSNRLLIATTAACLLAGCIDKENVAQVGDAENILITHAGAVLVTGGDAFVGVLASGTEWETTEQLVPDSGSCTGMAQNGNDVFIVCSRPYFQWSGWTFKAGMDTRLFHAKDAADPRDMQFQLLDHPDAGEGVLDSMVIPNGMAFGPDGGLLIANYNLLGQGSLSKVTLSYTDNAVSIGGFERDWIDSAYGVNNPNGVRVAENKLYLSDNDKVRQFYFDDQGDIPFSVQLPSGEWVSNTAPANVIYNANASIAIIDDIMPYCGGIALTRYLTGQLVYVAENGSQYQTRAGSFSFPSSLAVGREPVFDNYTLLVTEKGILGETGSQIGNRLSAVPSEINLNNPATCAAIQDL